MVDKIKNVTGIVKILADTYKLDVPKVLNDVLREEIKIYDSREFVSLRTSYFYSALGNVSSRYKLGKFE